MLTTFCAISICKVPFITLKYVMQIYILNMVLCKT